MIGWRGGLGGVLLVALLMLAFALKGAIIAPPSPPVHAARGAFDTARAIARLQRVLGDQRPHPVDSDADDAVRGRLVAELRAMGLRPQVQEDMNCRGAPKSPTISCSRIRNVFAVIAGRSAGPSVLLDAHYDSTATGPGAADDGIGVATLLEVGSLLKADPPPRPVILLFNEGEEFGLNGSAAFVLRNPLARTVNSLINIDARGVTGPAMMYEASDPNAAAIAMFARAAPRPSANSVSTDFSKLIPNTSDVVEFRPAGWTLLNFAIIGNETRYHTPGDTVAALDRASLFNLGTQVLALTRTMAATPDPASARHGRTLFTDIGGGRLFVQLPLPVGTALLGVLLVGGIVLARREKALGKPLLLVLAMVAAGILASAICATIATILRPGDFWRAYPLVPYLAVYAVVLAAMIAVRKLGSPVDRTRLRAAAWALILLLGGATSMALPGAIIFFLIAPAIAVVGMALTRLAPGAASVLFLGAALVQWLMLAQLLALVEILLIDGPLWAVAPVAALAALPFLVELDGRALRPAILLLCVTAVAFWVAAFLVPRSSAVRPEAFTIDYFRDVDRNTASWAIANKQAPLPPALGKGWRKRVLAYNGRTRWALDAPLLPTPIASAQFLGGAPAGKGRRVRLKLSSGGGDAIAIRFPENAKLLAIGMPGSAVRVPTVAGKPVLRCSGRACDGLLLEAVLADDAPVQAEIFSTRFRLPPEGQHLVAARPRDAIPQYAPDSSISLRRVRF